MIAPIVGGIWLGQQQWHAQEILNNSWRLAAGVNTQLAVSFWVPKAGVLDGFEVRTSTLATPQDLKCSFQDPNASDNPDGTVDQFAVVTGGSLAANSWTSSGALTSDGTPSGTPRTVTFGQRLTAVIEWNSTVGDVRFVWFSQAGEVWVASNVQTFLGSWTRNNAFTPVFALRYTDGTLEIPVGCWPLMGPTGAGQTLTSATTPDEIGLKFTLPWDCTLTAMTWNGAIFSRSADYDVVLYDAIDSVLATLFQAASWVPSLSAETKNWHPFPAPPTLTAGATYRVTIKPRTTNTIRFMVPSFNTSALRAAVQAQDTWQWTERTDGGSWTDRPTQRAPIELQIASTDAAALGVDCLPLPPTNPPGDGYVVIIFVPPGNSGGSGCTATVAAGAGNIGAAGCAASLPVTPVTYG